MPERSISPFNPDNLFAPILKALLEEQKPHYHNDLVPWETHVARLKEEFKQEGINFAKRILNAIEQIKNAQLEPNPALNLVFDQLEEQNPDEILNLSLQEFYKIGCQLYNTHDYQNAADVFFYILQFAPLYYNVWVMLGMSEQWLEHYDYAIRAYYQATLLNPNFPEPYLHLVQCFIKEQDEKSAHHFLEIILKNQRWKSKYPDIISQAEIIQRSIH